MQHEYKPQQIETTIQTKWQKQDTFKAIEDDREKFYCLEMFPYPSGKLHMGHVRNYTIGDVISRYQRFLGKNVLHPMGWDGFGLPAENAAIANKTAPADWTYKNIEAMREQLKRLGFSYDWSREIATCDPSYYQWEQWFFTQLYNRGLVYKKEAEVNWDPVDQTVLANEQVIDGRGWRSGALVERKKIPQWFIKISDYAEELLSGLDQLDGWPESVKTMQRNWIGKSVGAEIVFEIVCDSGSLDESNSDIPVFTTRPDTLFGVSYLAVAADHPIAQQVAKGNNEVQQFVEQCKQTSTAEADIETMEKLGIDLGVQAIHPISKELVPVYCANFVLMSYGTGAVMAVPAHDQRDFEFAKKYTLPIKPVILQDGNQESVDKNETLILEQALTQPGVLYHSEQFNGLTSDQASTAIVSYLVEQGVATKKINYRLRDWGVSRQRYWGCPIPMLYDQSGKEYAEKKFPVKLPEDIIMKGVGSPLKNMPEFMQAHIPDTQIHAIRETDTFDTFFESSWYYARYCCSDLSTAMLDQRADYWLPVDQYIGGIEHAVMHLLYARFFHKLLRDVGFIESDEPFTNLLTQGMVIADTYYRKLDEGKEQYFFPEEVTVKRDEKGKIVEASLIEDGEPVLMKLEKMSKSKNNGVDPQKMIEQYGADTVRLFTMFAAPPEQSLEWSGDAIAGSSRFLKRLWVWYKSNQDSLQHTGLKPLASGAKIKDKKLKEIRFELHTIIKRALRDYERQQFNTVVAAAMELLNVVEKTQWKTLPEYSEDVLSEVAYTLVTMLAPIVPHICEQVWSEFETETELTENGWLRLDETALAKDSILYVVQVNGKLRAKIEIASDTNEDTIKQLATQEANVKKFIENKAVRKIIVVKGKLINIVVS